MLDNKEKERSVETVKLLNHIKKKNELKEYYKLLGKKYVAPGNGILIRDQGLSDEC